VPDRRSASDGMGLAEVVIASDGHYLDANARALELTGYSLDEFRALRLGGLSSEAQQAATADWWRRLARETTLLPPGRVQYIRCHDGSSFPAITVGLERRDDGALVARWRPLTAGVGHVRPSPQHILADWRDAERRLEAAPAGSAERDALEREVESLRALYQRELSEARP
jgi:PAS domain-containing protein